MLSNVSCGSADADHTSASCVVVVPSASATTTRGHLTNVEVMNVKLSCTADEIEEFEGLSDTDLAALIRASLKKFRARDNEPDAEDDDPPANATTTGVRGGPKEGSKVAQDAAATLRMYGLSESVIRESVHPHDTSAADRRGAARLIPGLDRLK
jgi:hypothetical protein